MRDDTIRREESKLSSEEKKYLNSKARVVKRVVISIVEYIAIFILMMVIATYMEYGSLDKFVDSLGNIGAWLSPGGMIFNALVGFLPIIALSCIGVYFGEGTVGKMVFGIIKCVAIIIWLLLVFQGASHSLALPEVFSSMGLENLTVGMDGLVKFMCMVFATCILIPIGEFAGARKKHKRALDHKLRLADDKDF